MAITVTLDLDNKKFKDGLKKAGVDVKKTGGQVDKLGKKVKKFNVDSAKLGIGLAAVFAGGVYGLSKFVNAAADLETVTTQFEVLTGSVSSAKDHVKDLVKFTAKTPFQFDQVAVASKRLHAFGIETEDIMARLQNLGDISAASGKKHWRVGNYFWANNSRRKTYRREAKATGRVRYSNRACSCKNYGSRSIIYQGLSFSRKS